MSFLDLFRKPDPHTQVRYVDDQQKYFYDRVYMDPNCGCWIWLLSLDVEGRGHCKLSGETRAYRAAYKAFVGPIPPGHELHHICRNPTCVNPEHLKPVTRAEHARLEAWKYEKFRQKEFCAHGHPRTPENLSGAKGRPGKLRRTCKICARDTQARLRRAAKEKALKS